MTQYAGTADEKAAFAYDADGQLIYTTDGVLETWHAYHPTGHLRTTRIHAADGSVPDAIECRSVGPDGRLLERVLPEGNRVRYDYDARGLPASAVAGAWAPSSESWDDDCLPAFVGTPALGALGTVDYDQNGRPVRQVDGRFAITALEYDGFGRLARVIDPDGAVAQTGYDELGNPTWANVYEPGTAAAYSPATWTTAGLLGAEQQYYDGAGVLEQRDVWHFETPGLPIGDGLSSTTFGRDVAGRKRFAVDDFGHTTTVELDGLGRVRRVLLPTGDSIATDYDLAARAVTQTQTAPTADGSVSMTTYLTEWGAPSRVETNDLALPVVVASRFYDDRGRLQAETGASGAKATYELDALGRVASSVQDFGSGPLATLVLQRNRNGDVVRRDHDSGFEIATSIYKHDALGRVVLAIDPDGGTRSLRYEHATSLPSRITDARGITQHIAYTDTGRVSDVWASGGTELAHRSFEYDGRGRILAAIDDGRGSSAADDVITSFAWDSLGNQILEKNNIVGYAVQHRFDAGGRAIESTLGTLPVARNFDALGRTLDVFLEGDATPAAHFTYAGLGGPTSRYYDNSAATRFYYDDLGRLEGVADTRGGKLLADWDWQLPLDGVPRTATLRRAGFDAAASVFDLDREGRVELEAHDAPFAGGVELDPGASWEDAAAAVAGAAKGAADWRSYVLDARHNWRRRDAADPSLATSPSINTMDAYTTFAGASATYNAIGSLEWHGSDRYRYDDFGQLRYARRNGKWFEYRYDALGRIVEEIPHSSGEEPTRFSYDGDRRTLRLDSGVLHAMVSGDGLDEHLVEVAADGLRHYYHQDRQGSVYLITDRFGKPAEWYSYTAYGEVGIESPGGASLASSAIGNRFGFQGHLFNDTTGLVQMRARFYLPEWGRFINRDPIGLAGGSNRYAFVGSAPLAWTDPLGLAKKRLAREWQRQRMRWRVNRDVYSGNFKWAADEQVQLLEEWFTFESAGGTMEEYQEIVGDYLLQRARTYWDRAGTSKHLGPRDGTKPLERELRLNNANDANPVDWIGSSYFAYAKTTYLHDYMAAISVGISGAALTHSFYTGQFSSGFRASSTLPVGSRIPTTARDVLAHVRQHGAPPPGVRGGRVFRNDGRGGSQVLSRTDRNGNAIRYREWDVNPYQRGVNRGPERIVTGSDGRAYYTADHYRTFTEIQ
jgi:RHS repeat-associated protein